MEIAFFEEKYFGGVLVLCLGFQFNTAMPRYYCDYCDTYLTHDSVVSTVNGGRALPI
ncbi:hypothetical protein SO802_008267 [Lithocarpus litseifolius]|uniref:U1-C C2H2-type zinc finger domain-containing protein n=1 Tax=Lithocarpus litseifolius TaxID=425828 RepID=A0AAW2D850_9ROSI